MLLYIDDDRGIDLAEPSNWNVMLLDEVNNATYLDVDLRREGEMSFRPKVTIIE